MSKSNMAAKNTIMLKTDGGADVAYHIEDLDFINVMCDLEDKGIPVYAMAQTNSLEGARAMNMIRTIFSVLINEPDQKRAGSILSKHIKNGGDINIVMDAFSEAMGSAGFGESPDETSEETTEAME